MIADKNLFDQPINGDLKTYENITKIATGQGDDYTTGCLLHYSYFKENYKMIAIDLSKQQVLDADPRAITAQKNAFFIKNFFSKSDQICRKLGIWSHLLKTSLMENIIFRAVNSTN